jgi:hypothetical protein
MSSCVTDHHEARKDGHPPDAPDGLGRWGWLPDGPGTKPVRALALTVKAATRLQVMVGSAVMERLERHSAFITAVFAQPPVPPGLVPVAALDGLYATLRALWRMRWGNHRKELYWRLLLGALPTPARMHVVSPCACGLGGSSPNWMHVFWECPVARVVVHAVGAALGAPGPTVTARHFLLMQPPAGVHVEVWRVVCLAAVDAVWRQRASRPRLGQPPLQVPVAAAAAVTAFWWGLEDFVALGTPPGAWRRVLPRAHPFLHFPSPAGGLRVHYTAGWQPADE